MRKLVVAVFFLGLILSGIPMQKAFAMNCTEDTPINKAGDWFATLGKQGTEKDQILAKRKADRLLICAKKQAHEAGKTVEKAGKDLKKQFGL